MTRFLQYINEKVLTVDEYMPTVNAAIDSLNAIEIENERAHNWGNRISAYPHIIAEKLTNIFEKLYSEKKLPIIIKFGIDTEVKHSDFGVVSGAMKPLFYKNPNSGKYEARIKSEKIEIKLGADCYTHFIENFSNMKKSLSNFIEHELIHVKQFDKRTLDSISNRANNKAKLYKNIDKNDIVRRQKLYLSDKTEIMAFANSAVRELQKEGYNNKEILDIIRKATNSKNINKIFSMPGIGDYLVHFSRKYSLEPEKDYPIFKRFLKYMYQYIEHEEENSVKEQ